MLLKSSPTATEVLYLIMLDIDGNVDKNFQLSIFYRSRETDGHTDILNHRVASLLKRAKNNYSNQDFLKVPIILQM